ncbi:MAG TPA: hypothetical protein VHA78_02885 [Candidatus Peribacteraceae bacterium]|nr:hypothetical protein [Candidatus Peribacteraceae bacterium]
MRCSVRLAGLCLVPLLLSACMRGGSDQPAINFIGIGTGTLVTDVNAIHFRNTFKTSETKLVGVVSFAHIAQGSTVQATWFSPDERVPPLGRTTITTESGAKIARFSFASKEPWKPAPYELRIDASTGKGENLKTDSGTLAFFIGMTQPDIDAYKKDYAAYQKTVAEQNAAAEAQQAAESALAQQAARFMDARRAFVVFKGNLTGGGTDYVIQGSDTTVEDAAPPGGGAAPGVLYAAALKQFAILDGSGNVLLGVQKKSNGFNALKSGSGTFYDKLPRGADLQMAVLPSGSIALTWTDASQKTCTLEATVTKDHRYGAGSSECR